MPAIEETVGNTEIPTTRNQEPSGDSNVIGFDDLIDDL